MLHGLFQHGYAVNGGRLLYAPAVFRNGLAGRSTVAAVKSRYHFQHQGHIRDICSKNADLVKRRSISDETIPGNSSISGFEPNDPAEICRLAHGSAGIAAQGNHTKAGLYGHGRTAGGAAGNQVVIQCILHPAIDGILIAGAHGKFIAIQVTYYYGSLIQEPFHGSGIIERIKTFQDLRGGGHWMIPVTKHILNTDHHAMELSGLASGLSFLIEPVSSGKGFLRVNGYKGV